MWDALSDSGCGYFMVGVALVILLLLFLFWLKERGF